MPPPDPRSKRYPDFPRARRRAAGAGAGALREASPAVGPGRSADTPHPHSLLAQDRPAPKSSSPFETQFPAIPADPAVGCPRRRSERGSESTRRAPSRSRPSPREPGAAPGCPVAQRARSGDPALSPARIHTAAPTRPGDAREARQALGPLRRTHLSLHPFPECLGFHERTHESARACTPLPPVHPLGPPLPRSHPPLPAQQELSAAPYPKAGMLSAMLRCLRPLGKVAPFSLGLSLLVCEMGLTRGLQKC